MSNQSVKIPICVLLPLLSTQPYASLVSTCYLVLMLASAGDLSKGQRFKIETQEPSTIKRFY